MTTTAVVRTRRMPYRSPTRNGTGKAPTHAKPTALDRLAREIRTEHAAVIQAKNTALEHARRAGEPLIEVKRAVGHGAFGRWVEQHCHFSERTAQLYMRIANHWDEIAKAQRVTDLPLREVGKFLTDGEADPTEKSVGRIADGVLKDLRRWQATLQRAHEMPEYLQPIAKVLEQGFADIEQQQQQVLAVLRRAEPDAAA